MKRCRRLLSLVLAATLCAGLLATSASAAGGTDFRYQTVSGGMSHTLALKDGIVWAWGCNKSQQLGVADAEDSALPTKVEGLSAVISVAAGYDFSAALRFDGNVYLWGGNLGYTPTLVPGLTGIVAISAGQATMLALKIDGTVWQWTPGGTPALVEGLKGITTISAGGTHYMALGSSGEVYTWGGNWLGQLGDGSTTDHSAPSQVPGLLNVVDIAAGYSHSLAVTFNGEVYAWGSNLSGQLGNGDTVDSRSPVKVDLLKDAYRVSAGNDSSMALTKNGKLYTWGYGEFGQLGSGSAMNSRDEPELVNTNNSGGSAFIACGVYHNLLVSGNGTLYAWGRNKNKQLGTDQSANANAPQRVIDGVTAGGNYSVEVLSGLSNWSSEDVKALYKTGLVPPLLWSDFQKDITRSEFAHMLVNVYEQAKKVTLTPGSATNFTDVKGHYLETDLRKASYLGFLSGRSKTLIAPDDYITRSEAAKMLCTFVAKTQGVTIPTKMSSLAYYGDAAQISEWAVPYVAYAYEKDIMKGTGGNFAPLDHLTREQSLLAMSRLVKRYDWAS